MDYSILEDQRVKLKERQKLDNDMENFWVLEVEIEHQGNKCGVFWLFGTLE